MDMRICVNGVLRDAVAEEIEMVEAMEKSAKEYYQNPTPEERIAVLEDELTATKILLGLEE